MRKEIREQVEQLQKSEGKRVARRRAYFQVLEEQHENDEEVKEAITLKRVLEDQRIDAEAQLEHLKKDLQETTKKVVDYLNQFLPKDLQD